MGSTAIANGALGGACRGPRISNVDRGLPPQAIFSFCLGQLRPEKLLLIGTARSRSSSQWNGMVVGPVLLPQYLPYEAVPWFGRSLRCCW